MVNIAYTRRKTEAEMHYQPVERRVAISKVIAWGLLILLSCAFWTTIILLTIERLGEIYG